MDAAAERWRQITPSQFQWEAEALEYLRARLPDADPIQAWANFEFVSGGSLNEVDLLVATRKGLFLIEIKSHPGRISGSQSLWTWHRPDGTRSTMDNPLFLANTKAKRLKGLLQRRWTDKHGERAGGVPFIGVLVFLSAPDVEVGLSPELAAHVVVRDREIASAQSESAGEENGPKPSPFKGVLETIHTIGAGEAADSRFRQFTTDEADGLVRAMKMVGIKESTKSRRVGSYLLTLPAFAERGNTQDFLAQHEQHGTQRRVRIYSNVIGMSPEQSRMLKDAATREYLASERLHIDGVVRALDQPDTDLGPAVIYDHDRDAVRLDCFLAERGDELDVTARLRIVLRLAETLRQVHSRRVTHRMLTPQSVWLRPARRNESDHDERWVPEISDLSMAASETAGSALGATFNPTRWARLPTAAAGDIEAVLADPSVEAFLAPETYSSADPDGQALDVFSVGAIAYLLCAGVPPALTRAEMRDALGRDGLRISARLPEIEPAIDEFIREATCPVVTERYPRMADVVAGIELALEAIVAPSTGADVESVEDIDPLRARADDVLADRFITKRRLGKGSTALALLCADTQTDRDVVLKVSLGGSADDRIRAEAQALDGLRHPAVVEQYETVELAGRPALVLAFAGDRSLDLAIRQDGPASPEFLQRWGTDLLEAVRYLEREGRSHRDIKPDNLGIVAQGKNDERHLVLFDFSLAATPLTDLDAGTPGYLEPFIDQRAGKAWDLWAERYAVAVTLHELATGELPRWGDGQTHPAFTKGEATLALEALDPELRVPLSEFFGRALRREYAERFDTAEDMLRAWQRAFEGLDATADEDFESDDRERPAVTRGVTPVGALDHLPEKLRLDDPIYSLGVKGKLRSALRRLGVQQVGDLVSLDPATVNRTKGVSPGSRKAILRLRSEVLTRFADELAVATAAARAATTPTATAPSAITVPAVDTEAPSEANRQPAVTQPMTGGVIGGDSEAAAQTIPRLDLDALALRLVPPGAKRGKEGAVPEAVRLLLGLVPLTGSHPDDWPTNTAVAAQMGVTPARVSQALQRGRAHWVASPELLAVADDVQALLVDLGGVASAGELADALLDARPSGADPEAATRLAAAVLRAVVECLVGQTTPGGATFVTRRFGPRTLIALDGLVTVGDDQAVFDAAILVPLATALGERADQLIVAHPLVPSADAVAALRAVRASASTTLADGRLVRLAAAASASAVANGAADLVPRVPDGVDALRWSRPALVGAAALTANDIADRVRARFPTAELPGRPALDGLITRADLPLRWNDSADAYAQVGADPGALTTFTHAPSRHETVLPTPAPTVNAHPVAAQPTAAAPAEDARLVLTPVAQVAPEVQAAFDLEEHLQRSVRDGGFLAVRVPTDRLAAAQAELVRFQNPPSNMVTIDLERRFLVHLREQAEARKVSWAKLVEADAAGPASGDWARLTTLTGPAVDAVVDDVLQAGPSVIAWYPGALVRHQGNAGMGAIERLRDAVATRTGGLRTLWLVVAGSTVAAKPTIDGHAVPVIGPVEWADVTDSWLKNLHRAEGRVA